MDRKTIRDKLQALPLDRTATVAGMAVKYGKHFASMAPPRVADHWEIDGKRMSLDEAVEDIHDRAVVLDIMLR